MGAWFPVLEQNAGFLSLLALVVALAVAVFEHVRLINTEKDSFRRDRDVAIAIVDDVEKVRSAAVATADGHTQHERGKLRDMAAFACEALNAVSGARQHDAKFAIALRAAIFHLRHVSEFSYNMPREADLASAAHGIQKAREVLVQCKI